MAKTNILMLSAVVAAAVVAALVLVTANPAQGVVTTQSSRADTWQSTVNKVTGTITYHEDRETTLSGGGFHKVHNTVRVPVTLERVEPLGDVAWSGRGPAEVTINDEFKELDPSTGEVKQHIKKYGTYTMDSFFTELNVSSREEPWTSDPDNKPYSGDSFIFGPGISGYVPGITWENLLTGETFQANYFVHSVGYVLQPLPVDGFTLSGSAATPSGSFSVTWNLTGKGAQLHVRSDRERACPNQNITFTARNDSGNLVNARWSGGDNPATGTGSRFTTRYGSHGSKTVTAKSSSGASGTKTIKVLQESGLVWFPRFPEAGTVAALASPFRENVEGFLDALNAAGANVDINSTRRPFERAWLMHYSWRIAREGLDPVNVPARQGIDICWLHRNSNGTPDRTSSVAAARRMIGPNGYDIAFSRP